MNQSMNSVHECRNIVKNLIHFVLPVQYWTYSMLIYQLRRLDLFIFSVQSNGIIAHNFYAHDKINNNVLKSNTCVNFASLGLFLGM